MKIVASKLLAGTHRILLEVSEEELQDPNLDATDPVSVARQLYHSMTKEYETAELLSWESARFSPVRKGLKAVSFESQVWIEFLKTPLTRNMVIPAKVAGRWARDIAQAAETAAGVVRFDKEDVEDARRKSREARRRKG